ncbi:MAG TPA: V-type ATP synthase subunit F [Syntrophorhabdaceae bacterium]
MQFVCIGDEETAQGFRLAGITVMVVSTAEEASTAMEDSLARPDCGMVIITQTAASLIRPKVEEIRLERDHPLIVEIPGPDGPLPGRRSLREFVAEAVGVTVG